MTEDAEKIPLSKLEDIEISTEDKRPKYRWYQVNKDILPAKIAYFLDVARRIGALPNLVLFFTGIGLNKVDAGLILGFRLIGMLIAGPSWGVIADKFHCHRLILIINCIGTILTMGCQPFLAIKYGNPDVNKCPEPLQRMSNFNQTNLTSWSSTRSNKPDQTRTAFFIFFFVSILSAFFEASSSSFIDVATLRKSQLSKHRKIEYGRQRLWGPIGAIFGANVTNLIADNFPNMNVTCYSGLFLTHVVFTILLTITLLVLYKGLSFENKIKEDSSAVQQVPQQTLTKAFQTYICQFEIFLFYTTAVITGITLSPSKVFMFLYLKELGATSLIRMLYIAIAGCAAVFGYFFSGKIIKLIGGPMKSMMVALIVFSLRYLGFAYSPNGWVVLIFQPFHFLSFVLFLSSGMAYVKETSPLMVITSMVSLFLTMLEGVGVLVGSSIGGVIFKDFGGQNLFLIYSFIAMFWATVLAVYIYIFKKTKEKVTDEQNGLSNIEE
ncbi:major facilitator superfamily domain-containing protein 6-like [Clytia hemisphaerica]|uniref:Major facilitator superfamily (MFS) profile domain-containing protein n=1 Tax=Clytia hemisphaerica TaxID=252671 RepID=A0A7M5XCE1_9CNID